MIIKNLSIISLIYLLYPAIIAKKILLKMSSLEIYPSLDSSAPLAMIKLSDYKINHKEEFYYKNINFPFKNFHPPSMICSNHIQNHIIKKAAIIYLYKIAFSFIKLKIAAFKRLL